MTGILENISLSELTEAHLESLKTLRISEGQRLDYKSQLPMSTTSEKKELCKDVSSFAHAQGGFILFGVVEENALIVDIPGIEFGDKRQQQFLEITVNGLAPRLQRFEHHVIPLRNGKSVLVVHVMPDGQLHQVGNNDGRFYRRVGLITERMTGEDITTFLSGNVGPTPAERFDELVNGYHNALQSGTYFKSIPGGPFWTVVISPESPSLSIDLSSQKLSWSSPFAPLNSTGWNTEVTGKANYSVAGAYGDRTASAITEYNELGQLKAFDSALLTNGRYFQKLPEHAKGSVPSSTLGYRTIKAVYDYLTQLTELGVNPPFLVRVSLLGVKSYYLEVDHRFGDALARLLQGDDVLPDTVRFATSEDFQDLDAVGRKLRVVFDFIWREFGYRRSFNYDQEGNWNPPR